MFSLPDALTVPSVEKTKSLGFAIFLYKLINHLVYHFYKNVLKKIGGSRIEKSTWVEYFKIKILPI